MNSEHSGHKVCGNLQWVGSAKNFITCASHAPIKQLTLQQPHMKQVLHALIVQRGLLQKQAAMEAKQHTHVSRMPYGVRAHVSVRARTSTDACGATACAAIVLDAVPQSQHGPILNPCCCGAAVLAACVRIPCMLHASTMHGRCTTRMRPLRAATVCAGVVNAMLGMPTLLHAAPFACGQPPVHP